MKAETTWKTSPANVIINFCSSCHLFFYLNVWSQRLQRRYPCWWHWLTFAIAHVGSPYEYDLTQIDSDNCFANKDAVDGLPKLCYGYTINNGTVTKNESFQTRTKVFVDKNMVMSTLRSFAPVTDSTTSCFNVLVLSLAGYGTLIDHVKNGYNISLRQIYIESKDFNFY